MFLQCFRATVVPRFVFKKMRVRSAIENQNGFTFVTGLKAYENNKMFVFFKVRILVRIMKNHIFSVFLQYFHQQNSFFLSA